jgi:hypothetical protein
MLWGDSQQESDICFPYSQVEFFTRFSIRSRSYVFTINFCFTKHAVGPFCVTVSRHGLTVLPRTKKASDHPKQVSQDNQKSLRALAIFDIFTPPGDEGAYDRGFWRKDL